MGLAICRYLCRNIYGDQYRQQIDLSQASKDILRVIFDKLDLRTLGKISICSKTFNSIASEPRIWKRIVEEAGLESSTNTDKKIALQQAQVLKYLFRKFQFKKLTSVLDLAPYSKQYVVLSGDGFDQDPNIPTLNLQWGRYAKVLIFESHRSLSSINGYKRYGIKMIAQPDEIDLKTLDLRSLKSSELFIRYVTDDEEKIINNSLNSKTIKFS